MDTLEGLKKLAAKACEEETPVFGVTEQVLRLIKSESAESFSVIPLTLYGGISAVAASVILVLAIEVWTYMSSPVMELLAPLPEVPLW